MCFICDSCHCVTLQKCYACISTFTQRIQDYSRICFQCFKCDASAAQKKPLTAQINDNHHEKKAAHAFMLLPRCVIRLLFMFVFAEVNLKTARKEQTDLILYLCQQGEDAIFRPTLR